MTPCWMVREYSKWPTCRRDSLNNLVLHAVPGKPSMASPFTYQIPFSAYADWTISQGFHGQASHDDALNEYAVDFVIALGTPVLAARTGVVMEVIDEYPDHGRAPRRSDWIKANIIRILHEDGSMAVYGHLLQDSAVVTAGAMAGRRHGDRAERQQWIQQRAAPAFRGAAQRRHAARIDPVPDAKRERHRQS